ncbi:MAG: Spy/CpxP family protein refolding chaperone [Acidobacteriota bacterium]|jgi:protein CpxP|nr:Spy/CpxP family protein refolding chaperone [Acidobacteriota bacterium]
MKKVLVTFIAIAMVALGTIFVIGQSTDSNSGNKMERQERHSKFGKRGRRGMRGHGIGHMFRMLDLTDAQKEQMKTIRQTSRENTKSLREQMKSNRQQLQQLTENGTFDEGAVTAIAGQQGQLHAQMTVAKLRVRSQMYNVLTADQKAKLATIKAEFKKKMEERKAQWAAKKAERQSQQ